jgi:hypothetical protein
VAKIIHFPPQDGGVVEALRSILKKAEAGEIKKFVFAADLEDGCVATSWGNAEYGEMNSLIGHLQVDLTWRMIQANKELL